MEDPVSITISALNRPPPFPCCHRRRGHPSTAYSHVHPLHARLTRTPPRQGEDASGPSRERTPAGRVGRGRRRRAARGLPPWITHPVRDLPATAPGPPRSDGSPAWIGPRAAVMRTSTPASHVRVRHSS
uniref:Uncharacterized protein n=1 Tax=Arundo donax TaxID=35708 RepID=A0A0A9HC55_ARUDO